MSVQEADRVIRDILTEDQQRHGRWAVVHLLAAAISILLMPIPGPNLLGYYFTFRMVGHYLSRLGARHGLRHVTWRLQPSAPLTALRHAVALDADARRQRIADLAAELRLEHLPSFVERLTASA